MISFVVLKVSNERCGVAKMHAKSIDRSKLSQNKIAGFE